MTCLSARRARAWAGVWLPLAPAALVGWFAHHDPTLTLSILAVLGAAILLKIPARWLTLGALAVLTGALGFGLWQRDAATGLWETANSTSWSDLRAGTSNLGGVGADRGLPPRFAYQRVTGRADLSLESRVQLLAGTPGWGWYQFDPGFELTLHEQDAPFLRIIPPLGTEGNYLTREVDTGAPLGGRTFRARVELRSGHRFAGVNCQGLRIQALGGERAGSCSDVALSPTWQDYSLVWHAPPELRATRLRLSLFQIGAPEFDVRGGTLEERQGEQWVDLGNLEPSGLTLFALETGSDRPIGARASLLPTTEAHSLALAVSADALGGADAVTLVAQLEPGLEVRLDSPMLLGEGWLLSPPARMPLWFSHPNLAGHTLTAWAVAALALATGLPLATALALTAFASVMLTGSRSAAAALLFAGFAWLWRRPGRAAIWGRGVLLIAIISGSLLFPDLRLWQPNDGNTIPRTEIWRAATEALLMNPGSGWGTAAFPEIWAAVRPTDSRPPPNHAHNLWLELGVRYGIAGLLGTLATTLALVWLVWRWGRWHGLALAVPLLLMNALDYTLLYPGVYLPLILGANALRTPTQPLDVTPKGGDNEIRAR